MFRIGLRTVKTAVAILLCLVIFIVLKAFEFIPGVDSDFAITWFNPFFAGLATAYSMQSSRTKSIELAKNRCLASIIGGLIGILLIYLFELCGGKWPSLPEINLESLNFILPYLLIAIFAVLVIFVGNLLKQPQVIFVALLTFLSVTVNPGTTVPNWEFQFGINRILSTIVGVLIALGVNFMHLPHRYKNKDILFCIGMEGILKDDSSLFRGYLEYKFQCFKEEGINYTFFTTRTPSTFMDLAKRYELKNPIVCMSGAALYDPLNSHYMATEGFNVLESDEIRGFFKTYNITPFINKIVNDQHYIYAYGIDNEAELLYESLKKNSGYCNYLKEDLPLGNEVLYFLLLEEETKVDELVLALNKSNLKDKIVIQVYDFLDDWVKDRKLKYIKLYSKRIYNLSAFNQYKEENKARIVSVITNDNTYPIVSISDYILTIPSASARILAKADLIIPNDKYETLFKEMHRLYYKKKLNK